MKERRRQNQIARDHIVSAMMQLIREKPISEVTVQKLTELADVSRMTFYRNYSSKEAVFISHIHDILMLYQEDDTLKDQEGHFYDRKRIRHGFSYFYQYKDFVNALICCDLSDIFLQKLTEFAFHRQYQLQLYTGNDSASSGRDRNVSKRITLFILNRRLCRC